MQSTVPAAAIVTSTMPGNAKHSVTFCDKALGSHPHAHTCKAVATVIINGLYTVTSCFTVMKFRLMALLSLCVLDI